jgi:hypothetical protein
MWNAVFKYRMIMVHSRELQETLPAICKPERENEYRELKKSKSSQIQRRHFYLCFPIFCFYFFTAIFYIFLSHFFPSVDRSFLLKLYNFIFIFLILINKNADTFVLYIYTFLRETNLVSALPVHSPAASLTQAWQTRAYPLDVGK